MLRKNFRSDNLTLSYLDGGGDGDVLIALHAHWMEAATFVSLAASLAPAWRVIALDQRGHGYSDHAQSYTREDYIYDLSALFTHLDLDAAVLLGNSLGGVNAFQFAARQPSRVRALIIEDICAEVSNDTSFTLAWRGTFNTREELVDLIGPRFMPCLQDSIRQVSGGWRLAFDPSDTVKSQAFLNGNHWDDWLGTACPALLLRGQDSRVTTQEQAEEMASRRRNSRLLTMDGGHVIHIDNPECFTQAVRTFLHGLQIRNE